MLDGLRARLREEGNPPAERRARQDAANPAYVPRNAVMQDAIRAAEAGSFDEVRCRACRNGQLGLQCGVGQSGLCAQEHDHAGRLLRH